ncbi:hypothetical protein VRU48_00435 [Pedobacter sp. KR3-3]|uniref:Lipocalin-like domain-containing protein n=1 Tax=Pedobacter albus TaxID=3113905 RepID=A0ABU7I2B9_9SPHI|nr:hypothetical protein [Pedobacter sp. KR3-3]MEE1943552.1 hypothetical protein [Pedobacter sp. KR3-3]
MRKLIYLLILVFTFSACKKEKGTEVFNGTYEGSFIVRIDGKKTNYESKILFGNGKYKTLKGAKGGSGTFVFMNSTDAMVNFNDENIWTADFDWNLILSGLFTYKAQGDSLILTRSLPYTAENGNKLYQYRLKRIR